MTSICLAGPMTGKPGYNYAAFNALDDWLSAQGYAVLNPARSFDGDTTRPREDYLRRSLQHAIECDRIFLLEGWEESRGAVLELLVAYATGSEVWGWGGGRSYVVNTSRRNTSIEERLAKTFADPAPWAETGRWLAGTPAPAGDADPFVRELDAIKALQAAKRSDYTAGNADPLANYRFSASMVGLGVAEFMFGRMAEKMYRLKSIFEKGGKVAVADETIADTFRDIAIIALLCKLSLTPGTPHHDYGATDGKAA